MATADEDTATAGIPPSVSERLRGHLWVPKAYATAGLATTRDVRRFVILTEGRAGSEALVTRLNSHPSVLSDSEILGVRRRWPMRLIDGRTRLADVRGCDAYGFKVLTRHILRVSGLPDAAGFLHRLDGDGWLIVHLGRRNRLHQALSAIRAYRTQYHFEVGHVPAFEPLRVDPTELLQVLDSYAKAEAEAAHLLRGIEALRLIYEDDLERPEAQDRTVQQLVARLGLEPAPTSTRQVRINPTSAREMVANYEDVVAVLEDGPFARDLDPPTVDQDR